MNHFRRLFIGFRSVALLWAVMALTALTAQSIPAATNGNGGNILFDGQDGAVTPAVPVQGNASVAENGTGTIGTFTLQ